MSEKIILFNCSWYHEDYSYSKDEWLTMINQ